MVCKFSPPCCCNNLTVPDFSPSRWAAVFIQLETSSHQNVHSSLYSDHLANSTKPPLKTTSDHLALAPSSSPAPTAPALINLESGSPSFIHFFQEDDAASKAAIARTSSKTGLSGTNANKEINSVCFAAPLSKTMNTQMQQSSSPASLWRPWLVTRKDAPTECRRTKLACPYSRPEVSSNTTTDGKMQSFQHPVRLYWPRSKSYDYLFSDGEALLRNFPVQATISFYDESDSEEEEDEEDSCDEDDDVDVKECLKRNSHFTSYN